MSSPATAATSAATSFFDPTLLATYSPETNSVSHSVWVANLEKGIHVAIQLAENLLAELRVGAPSKDTMHSLFGRVLAISGAHEPNDTTPEFAKALSTPLAEAREMAGSWYLGCLNPESPEARRRQACPTTVAVSDLLTKLNSLVAVDENGQPVVDLYATTQPFFDRYNRSRKPYQVFETPLDALQPGGPLAWMTGKN